MLTPTEFASLWSNGKSFAKDPPNTAVKLGGRVNFNTVEIINVTAKDESGVPDTMHLIFRHPTDKGWGGPLADEFCTSTAGTTTALTLLVNPVDPSAYYD